MKNITWETGFTRTLKRSYCINTVSIFITVMHVFLAFIDIFANCSISGKPFQTKTFKRSFRIRAIGVLMTIIDFIDTLIDIKTGFTISSIAVDTVTCEWTGDISTNSVRVAIMKILKTFVGIYTYCSVTSITGITFTSIRSLTLQTGINCELFKGVKRGAEPNVHEKDTQFCGELFFRSCIG